tara:strand:+ start:166 stop:387 length:222 start_codon:yes stop_codon:yes gene_type:complete
MTLDILWGVTWWVLKKTRNGVNKLVYQKKKITFVPEKKRLLKLEEENKTQREQIVILREKIEIINNYLLKAPN